MALGNSGAQCYGAAFPNEAGNTVNQIDKNTVFVHAKQVDQVAILTGLRQDSIGNQFP